MHTYFKAKEIHSQPSKGKQGVYFRRESGRDNYFENGNSRLNEVNNEEEVG